MLPQLSSSSALPLLTVCTRDTSCLPTVNT